MFWPPFCGIVDEARVVSRFVVWPGAFVCWGVAGMLLEPLMGQPPPDGLFDFMGHPSACATRAALAVAAAAAADA